MASYEIQQIVKSNSITEYLASRGFYPARSSGNKYVYLCPLPAHRNDTDPSFYVFDKGDKQDFFCYGCKNHGTIINLVQKMEEIPLAAAIKRLSKGLNFDIDNIISHLIKEIINDIELPSTEEDIWSHAMFLASMTHTFLLKVNKDSFEFDLCEKMYKHLDTSLIVNDLVKIQEVEDKLPKKLRTRLLNYNKNKTKEEINNLKKDIKIYD